MSKYIIRLDDACSTMNADKWNRVESILNTYGIKPIVAVIPNNKDCKMMIDAPDLNFWDKVRKWQHAGWHIALHGYDHCYISNSPGMIPMNRKSEFAGVEMEIQRKKLCEGLAVFKKHTIETKIFVAPSHTFDRNTLHALRNETDINIISDGVATFPYQEDGFFWIPQQLRSLTRKRHGVWTFCCHPSMMNNADFDALDKFCNAHCYEFISDITKLQKTYNGRSRGIKDRLYFCTYFVKRYMVINYLYKCIIPSWHWIKRKINKVT